MEDALVKAYVDLEAIGSNVMNLRAKTDPAVKFMAVVKADGYGHGAVRVAKKALASGASWLGVARLHEAVELRNAGIIVPILIFGHVHPSSIKRIIDLNLTVSVYDFEMARALSVQAQNSRKSVKIHLKVDTGMGRVGMIIDGPGADVGMQACVKEIKEIGELSGIELEGIYTHFASADHKDKTYTLGQMEKFDALLQNLEKAGVTIKLRHAANSAGIIQIPQSHYDMVRAGISLYGLYPSEEVDKGKIELCPAMTLKSIITGVRHVPQGFKASYGMTWEAPEPTRIASVPVGYADGFSRLFSSNGYMLVRGHRVPIVGRVCMDQTMIDVGIVPDVAVGDEVILIGRQGDATLSTDELAGRIKTINYEIVSSLTSRVERIYSDSGSG